MPPLTIDASIEMTESPLGFANFIGQADLISKTLLVILLCMSIVSWTIILLKAIKYYRIHRTSIKFLNFFWHAESLESVRMHIDQNGINDPFSHLTIHAIHASNHHQKFLQQKVTPTLQDEGDGEAFLIRSLRNTLDETASQHENGLTFLATVSATAPFVGLFGTVWGIYHALIAISASGAGTIDKVAGPVGEALIMTGIGLAVAIPSVMAYNWFSRKNSVLSGKLDSFAYELLTFLSTGEALKIHR